MCRTPRSTACRRVCFHVFSVEPGIYLLGDIGVRSEVNVYWSAAGPVVTPAEIQRDLFFFLDG